MDVQLLLGGASIGAAVGLTWQVVATERGVARAATANLQRGLAGRTLPRPVTGGTSRLLRPLLEVLAARARRLTPAAQVGRLEQRLAIAGAPARWTVERVLASKVVAATVAAVLGILWLAASTTTFTLLLATAAAVLAWYAPDIVLRGRADERRALVARELPDVVDRLCITVDAGLGFDAALLRTARAGNGPLSTELLRAIKDVQLGARRADALQALADRTDVPELRRIVSSIRQAEEYGVPVSQVLRSESDALRDRVAQRAEERAAKMPVRVLFPLVFCILPALLVVVIGPAALNAAGSLGG